MERLQKFISNCGITSRRKAEELILKGKVTVNGQIIKELGTKVKGTDVVTVNGQIIKSEIKEYYILYKPRGVISAVTDNLGRKTVTDLINTKTRVYPIGRLDYDTTGILLLTNDGELSNMLTHPSRDIEKEYIAKVKGFFKKEDAEKLMKGVILNGVKTKHSFFKMKKYDKKSDVSYIKIIITEGRNHQIKDMLALLGYETLKLKRERFAFIDLSGLKSGEYRKLSTKEVKQLYSLK